MKLLTSYLTPPIFLSLGSNYSVRFAVSAMLQLIMPAAGALEKAGRELEQQLGGRPVFYYKGRDGIEQAVSAIQRKHRQPLTVFTQAATCYALEEGITRAGARTVYVDVGKHRLNMTVGGLQAAYEQAGKPHRSVVIVQHLLGFPAKLEQIAAWCNEHQAILLEDVAQAYGALTTTGAVVGTVGAVVVGSLGRDKVLDCVNGGFALVRDQNTAPQPKQLKNEVGTAQVVRDLLYPITTWSIRSLYGIGIGKLLFRLARRGGVLYSPIPAPLPTSSALPIEFGALLRRQLAQLDVQLAHRRQVAQMYFSHVGEWLAALHITEQDLVRAACLRVPVLVPDVGDFVAYLRRNRVHASDRWYRAAVDMGSFSFSTVYRSGTCPNAEFLVKHMCNLPTHQALSIARAEEIARLVRTYMNQPKVLDWYSKTFGLDLHV